MSAESFITEHLDLWTEAVTTKSTSGRGSNGKIEFGGIQKLRELILELAVRGKLSEQRSTDGSASQLLQQIDTNLNGSGKSKKRRLKALAASDQPYGIPSTWIWARLGMLGQIIGGGTPKSKESAFWTNDGVKWLTPADLYGLTTKTIDSGRRDITQEGLERSSARLLPAQSVLFSSRAPIGYVAINTVELATNQGFKSCVPHIDGLTDYLYYFLKRSAKHIDAQASGTTFKEISGSKFAEWPIALPPLAEQHRIVQKVDELMALCDRLERQTHDQHAAHATLVDALLDALTQSADADELADNWARLAAHFDTLFTTEHSIDRLEQNIVQLGLQGRLTKRTDKTDSPAALLQKISIQREQVVEREKMRPPRAASRASIKSEPFSLPNGWRWCVLEDLFAIVTDGDHQAPPKSDSGIPFLTIGNVNNGWIDRTASRHVPVEYYESLKWAQKPSTEDLLYTVTGSYGICVNINLDSPFCVQRHIAILKSVDATPKHYIFLFLRSRFAFNYATQTVTGIAQKTLSLSALRSMPIPVPPLDEQNRIVERVNELMGVCDQLKARLNQASETRRQMADAVTEQAIH